jgi:hypothetical protein
MQRAVYILSAGLLFSIGSLAQGYPSNEEGQYEDFLTPQYYHSGESATFRNEVNEFVYFARQVPFQHPLQDSLGEIPVYTTFRGFGDGIGPGGNDSHHPAIDYYIENRATLVNLYAAHNGYVNVSKDVSRYRHYLSITSDITDSLGVILGKMLSLYAHVDLDLDQC